jgi:hypothetical protein
VDEWVAVVHGPCRTKMVTQTLQRSSPVLCETCVLKLKSFRISSSCIVFRTAAITFLTYSCFFWTPNRATCNPLAKFCFSFHHFFDLQSCLLLCLSWHHCRKVIELQPAECQDTALSVEKFYKTPFFKMPGWYTIMEIPPLGYIKAIV